MADYIHSVLSANQVITADGDVTFDLPVNPLSVILLHASPLNNTGTIGNYRFLGSLLTAFGSVRVTHKGSSVVDARGDDLAVLSMLFNHVPIVQTNNTETDGDRRSLVLPILFGRRAFMASECFPESRRGELLLTITFDIAGTGFDGLRVSIETIELPDASPAFVQKVTTLAQTFTATGQNDIDIPIGNVLRGVLLFGTTGFVGATPVPSLGQLEFLIDNRQRNVSSSDFEVMRAVMALNGGAFPSTFEHIHSVNAAGAGREDTLEPQLGASLTSRYALMQFDPTMDDEYAVDTQGAGRVNVRVTAETADLVRALPIEKVPVAVFTG